MIHGARELLFFVLLAGILGGATALAFCESESERYSMIQETLNRRQATSVLLAQLAASPEVQQSTVQLQQTSEELSDRLKKRSDLHALQRRVAAIAKRHHLSSFDLKIDGSTTVRIASQPSCTFTDFYQSLSEIEQLQAVRLQDMSVKQSTEHDVVASAEFGVVGEGLP